MYRVLEFQQRGVPHFHFFSSISPDNDDFREWAAVAWNKIIGDSEQNLLFQKHRRNFIEWKMDSGKYLVKEYLAKCDQKHVPEEFHNVGRFWGNSRSMKPVSQEIIPGVEYSKTIIKKAVRIVTKRREKYLKKWIKINFRQKITSYSLPSMTYNFITLLEYYKFHEGKQ
jgi:hypothetical protein